jgi:hypothetical protein
MLLMTCLPGIRPLQLVGVAVLVGALALLAYLSRDGAFLPGEPTVSSERARLAELEEKLQVFVQRVKRKQRVTDELVAGRLTLLEAAALFRALDLATPAINWDIFRASTPGNSDDERHCHEVIDWVFVTLRVSDLYKAETLRQDLDRQLGEHQRLEPLRLDEIRELPSWIDD